MRWKRRVSFQQAQIQTAVTVVGGGAEFEGADHAGTGVGGILLPVVHGGKEIHFIGGMVGGKRVGKHRGSFHIQRRIVGNHTAKQGDVGGVQPGRLFGGFFRIFATSYSRGDLVDFSGREEDSGGDVTGGFLFLFVELAEGFGDGFGFLRRRLRCQSVFCQGGGESVEEKPAADALEALRLAVLAGMDAGGPFEALAGQPGAVYPAEERGFRGADVIPVQAGAGKGLEDVEFDEFHDVVEV